MPWSNQAVTLIVLIESATGFTGLFAYSPSPGFGNLVASVTAAAGTDPFGNSYSEGIATYGPGPSTRAVIALSQLAGVATASFASGAASEGSPAQITESVRFPNTSSEQIIFQIFGPKNSTNPDGFAMWIADSIAATPLTGALFLNYIDTAAVTHGLLIATPRGLQLPFTEFITAIQPGTSGTGMAQETWHNLSLNAGFTTTAGFSTPRYRFEPLGAGVVRLSGVVTLTANQAAGAGIATLPAGYRPAATKDLAANNNLSGALNSPIQITTAGGIHLGGAATSGNFVSLDGLTFELD